MPGKSPHVARMVLMVAAGTKPVQFSLTGDPKNCWSISFGKESTTANRSSVLLFAYCTIFLSKLTTTRDDLRKM